ncbi:unnamed protein product [Lampetra fluviatilis]
MADSDRTSIHEVMSSRRPGALSCRALTKPVFCAEALRCSCPGAAVYCHERSLASVPAGIPTTTRELLLLLRSEELASLPTGVFDNLTQLVHLELNNNQLKTVPRGAINKRKIITLIFHLTVDKECLRFLHSEELASLSAGLFDRMENLQHLYMENIKRSAVPVGLFDKLTQLTHLGLHNNQLKSVPRDAFYKRSQHYQARSLLCRWAPSSCPETDVDCHGRSLESVPAGIPSTTRVLRLYNNQITKLEPGVLDSLTQLTNMDLGGNRLQALPEGVFDRLMNLQLLALNDNQLKSGPRGATRVNTAFSLLHRYPTQCIDYRLNKSAIVSSSGLISTLNQLLQIHQAIHITKLEPGVLTV